MAEVPISEAWPAVRAFLETTHYGRIWLAGAVVLLIGVLVNSKLTEGRLPTVWAQRITGISLALFALSRTLVSHAVVNGDVSWAVAVDWLHLILICVWVGEVFVSGLIVLRKPIFGDSQDRQAAVYYINVLSTSATIALIGIVLTGILNAVRGIGNVENLLGNQYSNVLITKLVFVVIAIGLGGFNRFMVMPDFLTGLTEAGPVPDQPQRKFLLVLMVEAAVLTGALVAAAILSGTAPPTAS